VVIQFYFNPVFNKVALFLIFLSGYPQVVRVLYGKPAFRSSTNRDRKTQGHFWRDAAGTIKYPAQCRCGNAQFFSKFTIADVVGFKVNVGK